MKKGLLSEKNIHYSSRNWGGFNGYVSTLTKTNAGTGLYLKQEKLFYSAHLISLTNPVVSALRQMIAHYKLKGKRRRYKPFTRNITICSCSFWKVKNAMTRLYSCKNRNFFQIADYIHALVVRCSRNFIQQEKTSLIVQYFKQ